MNVGHRPNLHVKLMFLVPLQLFFLSIYIYIYREREREREREKEIVKSKNIYILTCESHIRLICKSDEDSTNSKMMCGICFTLPIE